MHALKHVLNHVYKKDIFSDIGYLKPLYFDNKIFIQMIASF